MPKKYFDKALNAWVTVCKPYMPEVKATMRIKGRVLPRYIIPASQEQVKGIDALSLIMAEMPAESISNTPKTALEIILA